MATSELDITARWAHNIRAARKASGFSQAKVAEGCGVDQCTVSRWERGTMVPTEENKVTIATFFGQQPRVMFDFAPPAVEAAS